MNVAEEVSAEILLTPCVFCANEVRYYLFFSFLVSSPEKTMAVAATGRWPSGKQGNASSLTIETGNAGRGRPGGPCDAV